ncbi:hypothetical protein BKA64DRAFT_682139 [Cadophora sp. MPI-SDFR-AT-0126]|nr:hypothetical protein BKA64DRAFT_682139 [Leotiomycetes sp. MPI-SDFR-AT-0126]
MSTSRLFFFPMPLTLSLLSLALLLSRSPSLFSLLFPPSPSLSPRFSMPVHSPCPSPLSNRSSDRPSPISRTSCTIASSLYSRLVCKYVPLPVAISLSTASMMPYLAPVGIQASPAHNFWSAFQYSSVARYCKPMVLLQAHEVKDFTRPLCQLCILRIQL